MTQIIQILVLQQREEETDEFKCLNISKILTKIEDFLANHNFTYYQQNNTLSILLENQYFSPNHLIDLALSAILKFSISQYGLKIELTILDDNGNSIKAKSQHQKTSLPFYLNSLNSRSNCISFMCNPISGEIKFVIKCFLFDFSILELNIQYVIQNILIIIQQHKYYIEEVLEFLEYVPPFMNKFVLKISEKMEKCRTVILGQHVTEISSKEQEEYQQYFLEPLPEKELIYSWQTETRTRIFFQQLIQKLRNKLIMDPLTHKKSNWVYIQPIKSSNDSAGLQRLEEIKSFMHKGINLQNTEHEHFTQEFELNNKSRMKLDFLFKTSRRCQQQLKTIERISKINFYKFIREYVCIKNYELLNKNYLIRKHQEFIKLHEYLIKNKMTLSFMTRLSLCYQLVSVGYFTLASIKKFAPSYQSYDLNISQDHSIKLESLVSHYRNSVVSAQIAQTCYQILYNIRCSSHCLKEIDQEIKITKWFHSIKSIDDGEAKYQSISILTYWIKKILTDIINNESYKANNINLHKKTYVKSNDSSNSFNNNLLNFSNFVKNGYSSTVAHPQKQKASKPNMEEIQNSQKQELGKILFVISLAYKYYSQIFEYKVPIFDIEL